ncbi:fatty acid-binding protein-like [Neodiprion pinetum]|uniref:Fatty acid-binding protein homolog 5 n=1 Tax=Neodiprion lecontei TaxID=441921 RepID=A0A6J0B4W7_NEOLC|nr:fatty acid-binding protein homolog 5 [Neodiprion lecontei]XP_046484378.1 fatty acid-binding protein homolog 5-like [Neodiprion pinetum]
MAEIVGVYRHERSENFDEYFKAVGVPYIGRKMMAMSNPRLEIEQNGEKWTIRNVSAMRTNELTFTPGTEYEESMPSGDVVKNVTDVVDGRLVTNSISPNGSRITRTYEFTPEGAILTMTHEASGQVAKRFYKRVVAT